MTGTVGRARVSGSVMLVVSAMMFAEKVDAADLDVTASVSVVRSAPSDVAAEVGPVHAGDRLVGSDQPSGEWRFVKLPDGRGGYLRDRDARVVASTVGEMGPTSAPLAVNDKPHIEAPKGKRRTLPARSPHL